MFGKRPSKIGKSFRLTWAALEQLAQIVRVTGWSEAVVIEIAMAFYYQNHPEYWPSESDARKDRR